MQMTMGKTICSYCKIFLTIFLGIFLSETSEELRLGENAFKLEFFCYEKGSLLFIRYVHSKTSCIFDSLSIHSELRYKGSH